MQFDPENTIIKLCAQGMEKEGEGKAGEALGLFLQAWKLATNDFERFTAAHYVARHQNSITDKLTWDETALNLALKLKDANLTSSYPSLYLNVAKCYEDLKDFDNAEKNYQFALSFSNALPKDGYGSMIKLGITNGLKRISLQKGEDS